MKKKKILSVVMLLLMPLMVSAKTYSAFDMEISMALFVEAFVSIHMSIFVLLPLVKMFSKPENVKHNFLVIFGIRAAILLFFDFFITTMISIVDFLLVFIGAFIIVPLISKYKNESPKSLITPYQPQTIPEEPNPITILKCSQCGSEIKATDKFCTNCGAPITETNVAATPKAKEVVDLSKYDMMYSQSEDDLLEEFLKKELTKAGVELNNKLVPNNILKRKIILKGILAILLFIYLSMIFFHFPLATYIIGLILLVLFYIFAHNYNLLKYLKKEVKARPSEKIANIVMNTKNSFVKDNSLLLELGLLAVAILAPIIIFKEPRIMYEKLDDGYGVRFYTFGLTNFKTATIPDTYNGEEVVSLRGNTFSNMPFLEEVSLPDTITEIRGQAFKNDTELKKVNIPSNLEYLGGGAFYNCSAIMEVNLPDSLTYLGGEAFYNAKSLIRIKLSKNIQEIRGNTFENCSSLRSIEIPDKVERIGAHAFYNDFSLENVTFTPQSSLKEIGSSAFRLCSSLDMITLPKNVYINERAFKESPTYINYFA